MIRKGCISLPIVLVPGLRRNLFSSVAAAVKGVKVLYVRRARSLIKEFSRYANKVREHGPS